MFENHRIRRVVELEGIWDFVKEDGKKYILPVPGCWEQHPDMLAYRGMLVEIGDTDESYDSYRW